MRSELTKASLPRHPKLRQTQPSFTLTWMSTIRASIKAPMVIDTEKMTKSMRVAIKREVLVLSSTSGSCSGLLWFFHSCVASRGTPRAASSYTRSTSTVTSNNDQRCTVSWAKILHKLTRFILRASLSLPQKPRKWLRKLLKSLGRLQVHQRTTKLFKKLLPVCISHMLLLSQHKQLTLSSNTWCRRKRPSPPTLWSRSKPYLWWSARDLAITWIEVRQNPSSHSQLASFLN